MTYTYAAWVKDRSGKVSPVAVNAVAGDEVRDRGDVDAGQVRRVDHDQGSTLRIDNKAYAGLPVNVYVRPKNVVDVQVARGVEDDVDRDLA